MRNHHSDFLVRDEVNYIGGCEWVTKGEGVATEKIDGTSCLVRDNKLYKRYEIKPGKEPPEGWIAAGAERDPVTGKWPGWIAVGDGPEDKRHRETFALHDNTDSSGEPIRDDYTYELVGPGVQSNPLGLEHNHLIRHGASILADCPRTFEGIKEYLASHDYEGVVWWRDLNDPGCDKVKIKKVDFFKLKKAKA